MDILDKQKLICTIEQIKHDALCEIEENRIAPSERGAGTCPSDSALCNFNEYIDKIVNLLLNAGVTLEYLNTEETIEDVISYINGMSAADQEYAKWQQLESLKEVDEFNRDYGEAKYFYANTIYLHKPTGKYIRIERQYSAGEDPVFCSLVDVQETSKKEIIKCEWI